MPERSDADVLVVGAGASGLTAGVRLVEAGRAVRIIEGRSRTGGRILTQRDPRASAPVELGAEFVHGDAPLTRALLRAAGARAVPWTGDAWQGRHGRIESGEAVWRGIERILAALDRSRDPDRSFADFLRAEGGRFDTQDIAAARAFVEGFFAADPERIGERGLAGERTQGAEVSDRIAEGYDVIVRHLAARLPRDALLLGWTVKHVRWRPGRVTLEAARTQAPDAPAAGRRGGMAHPAAPSEETITLTARAVVVTVPLGVLSAPDSPAGIRFDPPLPTLPRALQGLAMGPVVRVTMAFAEPLWGSTGLMPTPAGAEGAPSFLHATSRAFNAFWSAEPSEANVLVAWSGGARSAALRGGPDALARRALADLAAATGTDESALRRALSHAWFHDWRSDPYSLGAYTYLAVDGACAPGRLAEPVGQTVFSAGEATSADEIGTVEGALASGERAVAEVLASYRSG